MVGKRELIEPNRGDRRYARRDARGRFTKDQSELGLSLAQDRRIQAEQVGPRGQGDRGERPER
jgi:hypothetical protein